MVSEGRLTPHSIASNGLRHHATKTPHPSEPPKKKTTTREELLTRAVLVTPQPPPREELLTGAVLITPHSARGVRGGSSSHWLARRQELLTRRCSPRRGNFHALRVRSSSHSLASVESSFCPGAHHVQHVRTYMLGVMSSRKKGAPPTQSVKIPWTW